MAIVSTNVEAPAVYDTLSKAPLVSFHANVVWRWPSARQKVVRKRTKSQLQSIPDADSIANTVAWKTSLVVKILIKSGEDMSISL